MAEPLRQHSAAGIYQRPINIETEIGGLILLSKDDLASRAKIVDNNDPHYMSSEAILYFLRKTRLYNSDRNFETIYRVLINRIKKTLPGRGRNEGDLDAAAERAAKDPVKYQQYAQAAGPTITAHGGRIVSRGALDRALVGATEPHGTAVIEFPDMQTMEAWFASKDYQALVPVRDEGCEMQLLAYDQPTS